MAASQYSSIKSRVESLLVDGLGSFLADYTDGRGMHAPSALLGQQLTKAFEQYYALKLQLETGSIDCAIMAITKSGKGAVCSCLSVQYSLGNLGWLSADRPADLPMMIFSG